MTQEQKQLLLKDLCARLPYGIICKLSAKDADVSVTEKLDTGGLEHFIFGTMDVKPYLRPLSSMTEEERDEFRVIGGVMAHNVQNDSWAICAFAPEAYDWLNAHHFDYRIDPFTGKTLIESNLAIEAPKDMYKTE